MSAGWDLILSACVVWDGCSSSSTFYCLYSKQRSLEVCALSILLAKRSDSSVPSEPHLKHRSLLDHMGWGWRNDLLLAVWFLLIVSSRNHVFFNVFRPGVDVNHCRLDASSGLYLRTSSAARWIRTSSSGLHLLHLLHLLHRYRKYLQQEMRNVSDFTKQLTNKPNDFLFCTSSRWIVRRRCGCWHSSQILTPSHSCLKDAADASSGFYQ